VEVYQDDVLVGTAAYVTGGFYRVFPLGAR
jgi:hypothetical protein